MEVENWNDRVVNVVNDDEHCMTIALKPRVLRIVCRKQALKSLKMLYSVVTKIAIPVY
jgi:hypothetical protein